MKPLQPARLVQLLRGQRWACLGTQDSKGQPYVSWVAYVAEADFSGLLLHLSRLAKHTRNMEAEPFVSLAMSEADDGVSDPQQLARLTLQGRADVVGQDDVCYEQYKALYLARLPDSEMIFQFADFSLYRFVSESGRYVEGFASSHAINAETLRAVANV